MPYCGGSANGKGLASPFALSLSLNAQCRFLLCFDALKKIGLPQEGRRGYSVGRFQCNHHDKLLVIYLQNCSFYLDFAVDESQNLLERTEAFSKNVVGLVRVPI